MFDPALVHDPHAAWFLGRLTCPFIDDLWNDYDKRIEADLQPTNENPYAIIDPSRKSGLTRDHPFVIALFKEVLKRLEPLVQAERERAESERASIENRATRQRLNKLEQAAAAFMDQDRDDETTRDKTVAMSRNLRKAGYALNPPFKQLVKGESTKCSLTVTRTAFPEIEVGDSLQVECETDEISSDYRVVGLEPDKTDESRLVAHWKVTAEAKTSVTGIRVSVGPITANAVFEIFDDQKEQYARIQDLQFSSKRYKLTSEGKKKKIRLYCPIEMVSGNTPVDISFSSTGLALGGPHALVPKVKLGIAVCDFRVSSSKTEVAGMLTAKLRDHTATADIFAEPPRGIGIKIKLEPHDFGNDRSRWRHNVLELAAKHPSLSRYLGPESENFPGQDSQHFRLLIAEVVADAVCGKKISVRERDGEYEDEERDWNFYSAVHSELMTQFLPIAHKLQVKDIS